MILRLSLSQNLISSLEDSEESFSNTDGDKRGIEREGYEQEEKTNWSRTTSSSGRDEEISSESGLEVVLCTRNQRSYTFKQE